MHVVDAEENKRRHESRNWGDILCRFPGRKLVRGTLPCRCKAAATQHMELLVFPVFPAEKRIRERENDGERRRGRDFKPLT